MKKLFITFLALAVSLLSFYSCSDEESGKPARYQVIITQSGDYQNYIKSVVIAANGTTLKDDIANTSLEKTIFGDEDLTAPVFSVSTEGTAIQFAVSLGAIDKDNDIVSQPMFWDIVVKRDGQEIDRHSLTFKDGQTLEDAQLNLYYE